MRKLKPRKSERQRQTGIKKKKSDSERDKHSISETIIKNE